MLKVNNTALVLVDVQGKLAQIVNQSEEVIQNIVRLVKGAQTLNLPIIWLEQYPKGLGPTTNEIQQLLEKEYKPIAKMRFSPYEMPAFQEKLAEFNRDNFLVAGIETHICVYQLVRELLTAEKHVEFVADAISSRTELNNQIGIEKMKLFGAVPTSVEMALFELLETAEHPNFKEISKIIK